MQKEKKNRRKQENNIEIILDGKRWGYVGW
jgi:hypothetical protein